MLSLMGRRLELKAMKRFGKRVREIRRNEGWSLKDFAKVTGYSVGHISFIEQGKSGYSVSVGCALVLGTFCGIPQPTYLKVKR